MRTWGPSMRFFFSSSSTMLRSPISVSCASECSKASEGLGLFWLTEVLRKRDRLRSSREAGLKDALLDAFGSYIVLIQVAGP